MDDERRPLFDWKFVLGGVTWVVITAACIVSVYVMAGAHVP